MSQKIVRLGAKHRKFILHLGMQFPCLVLMVSTSDILLLSPLTSKMIPTLKYSTRHYLWTSDNSAYLELYCIHQLLTEAIGKIINAKCHINERV